ncbi:MAG: hypothetical protein N2255_09045 [Kiritimatiellae bacterium]|nr:hypothetical protein [Kiritimatiellia bacterium]
MNIRSEGLCEGEARLFANSIFQRRLEIELTRHEGELPEGLDFFIRFSERYPDGVELVCRDMRCCACGLPVEVGVVRIPRRAYEVYPYYPGDSVVHGAIAQVHFLVQQVLEHFRTLETGAHGPGFSATGDTARGFPGNY